VTAALVVVQVRRPASASPLSVSASPAATHLSCSLPIAVLSVSRTTGFIDFRHGQATFRAAAPAGTTYVPALGRWVPVLPQMVAPDGRSYVEETDTGGQTIVRVVDASGTRIVLRTGRSDSVFGFAPQGILLIHASDSFDGVLGLELLDPATGAVRPLPFPPPRMIPLGQGVRSNVAAYRREDDAIWMTSYYPVPDATVVRRYDLATGVTTEWFDGRTDGNGHVVVVATDGHGQPILQVASADLLHNDPASGGSVNPLGVEQRTVLLTAPHRQVVLNAGRIGEPGVAGTLGLLSANDGDRVWLAGNDGTIWMYMPGSPLLEAATVRTPAGGAPAVAVSGPCH
jgi:hypothetical protein